MSLRSSLPSQHVQVGRFDVAWVSDAPEGPHLRISCDGRRVWSSCPGEAFVGFTTGESTVEESRGFFTIADAQAPVSDGQTVDSFRSREGTARLSGGLGKEGSLAWWIDFVAIDEVQLQMTVTVDHTFSGEPRTVLRSARGVDARVFGMGAQYTHADLRGRTVDALTQEPGIGRGVQPLTWLMNAAFGAGGDDTRSSAPVPHYLTSDCTSLCLENHELSRFDFTRPDRVTCEVWSSILVARVFAGDTPAAHIEAYTRFSGRMPALPDWMQTGAIVGMQGGTEKARSMWARLKEAGAPIAAFWLQDWVGSRSTSVGSQLWWNWELDRDRYPDWEELTADLRHDGIRVMSYINPFLVDVAERDRDCERNLYREAEAQGFLVRRPDGSVYEVQNTSFSAAMVDFSNPRACAWLKRIIAERVIGVGVSGWMADFGEALPFDATLHSGIDAAIAHNEYPEAWARLNREAIAEAGLEGDAVFFARSGFTRSPRYATLFWLGDQLTSWEREDGIWSALTGLLSSGFSGFSQNHSDIGGYITTAIPNVALKVPFVDYRRSPELLRRWIELNAFTAVFRTHEGNQPERNHQVADDPLTLGLFAKFARVYALLGSYRAALGVHAEATGLPVVRHMWVVFPEDPTTVDLHGQFMLGDAILVAPVLAAKTATVTAYLPVGEWRHLWTDAVVVSTGGTWVEVDAPIGFPAVFIRSGHGGGCGEALMTGLDGSGDRSGTFDRAAVRAVEAPR